MLKRRVWPVARPDWSVLGTVYGLHCNKRSCGLAGFDPQSVPNGLGPWMLMRDPWPVDHPDRSVLQEGSKGPLPEEACDSQPLARKSMDQAVSMLTV